MSSNYECILRKVNDQFPCLKLHVPLKLTSTGCTIQKIEESDFCKQRSQVGFRKDFEKRTCSESPVQDLKTPKRFCPLGHPFIHGFSHFLTLVH